MLNHPLAEANSKATSSQGLCQRELITDFWVSKRPEARPSRKKVYVARKTPRSLWLRSEGGVDSSRCNILLVEMCVSIVFCPIEPFFYGAFRCQSCHTFKKTNNRVIRPECKKENENITVLNKQKRIVCVFKCWLDSQLASLEALLSLESTIDDPTPSWRSLFCVLSFFNASLQPHKNDSRLSLMRILHAYAHQSFRSVDPQMI